MKKTMFALALLLAASPACADLARELERLVGFTIIASKTIAGYQDKNGKLQEGVIGCDFDRVIVFDDNKMLTCAAIGYETAFRPTAIILSDGTKFKMIVGNEIYEMKQ